MAKQSYFGELSDLVRDQAREVNEDITLSIKEKIRLTRPCVLSAVGIKTETRRSMLALYRMGACLDDGIATAGTFEFKRNRKRKKGKKAKFGD